jgi:hypothetical protein
VERWKMRWQVMTAGAPMTGKVDGLVGDGGVHGKFLLVGRKGESPAHPKIGRAFIGSRHFQFLEPIASPKTLVAFGTAVEKNADEKNAQLRACGFSCFSTTSRCYIVVLLHGCFCFQSGM